MSEEAIQLAAAATACPCCDGPEPVHQNGCALAEILAQTEGRG